ncbi:hypothetical protein QMK19_38390 [Streptomyces sp. H10-C2]|uniref:hypothetical protein n=1 Tax=unclassified Streptomyces TaxID=2593676 RepID=UPI0024BA1334|nr:MULTISPECIES: hypothetical protein [unclassified Streptomyces]MDJ0347047.1 hypothetical protein [Streptomyces sp. PH10-H1]MDJ0375315.1 hypothetical protein [Streptomyces sp. H10-C2]
MDGQEDPDRHDGAEPPAAAATPPVRALLPDGQVLTARLLGRFQVRSGAWFYDLEMTAWSLVWLPDREVAEPAPVRFAVPATHVRPVPDTSYEGVPLRRHPDAVRRRRSSPRSGAPEPPAPAPGPEPLPKDNEWQLYAQRGDPPRRRPGRLRPGTTSRRTARSVTSPSACPPARRHLACEIPTARWAGWRLTLIRGLCRAKGVVMKPLW